MDQNIPAHPYPPADLNELELPLCSQRGPWFRIYKRKHGAIHFAKDGVNRFDDPQRKHGVLYVAGDFYGAFIETLGWSTGSRNISEKALSVRRLAKVISSEPLRFIDLTGSGLAHIGADGEICTGRDRYLSQLWSHALWRHPAQPDGIRYISRHDPQRNCYALFEQNVAKLEVTNFGSLNDPSLLAETVQIIEYYKFALVN